MNRKYAYLDWTRLDDERVCIPIDNFCKHVLGIMELMETAEDTRENLQNVVDQLDEAIYQTRYMQLDVLDAPLGALSEAASSARRSGVRGIPQIVAGNSVIMQQIRIAVAQIVAKIRPCLEGEYAEVVTPRAELKGTAKQLADFIDANPGKTAKEIKNATGISESNVRKTFERFLAPLGYYNKSDNSGYFPPRDTM